MTNLPKCGMSLKEIAEAEGISVGAVNEAIQRALRKLRNQGLMLPMQELAQELDRGRKGCAEWKI